MLKHIVWAVFLAMVGFILFSCNSNSTSTGGGSSLDSSKAITAFSFISPAKSGIINESAKTIAVLVPYGTNVTALFATFSTTGVSVKVGTIVQTSGSTANDFTNPKAYTVTAADGSTATYTVTVTVKASVSVIDLAQTGQTMSYGPGDDGALQKGLAWPSPRFTDNSDGTVTDNLTGLMWLKDANCAATILYDPDSTGNGRVTWQHALDFVAGINAGTYSSCGAGHTDWRLPNRKEMRSLADYSQYNPALSAGNPFIHVLPEDYWSSTTNAIFAESAWYVYMVYSYMASDLKTNKCCVWPVRAGKDSAPAAIPKTGQTICYNNTGTIISCTTSTGQDGYQQKGVAWPAPRFSVASSGTGTVVADNLTGLMWAGDAGTPSFSACTSGVKNWYSALDYVSCLNTNNYLNHSDWRMPNVNELESLVHSEYPTATWLNTQGFTNVQPTFYWSSTSSTAYPAYQWSIIMESGDVIFNYGNNNYYVWPVRGGQ